ncbi:MAG: hypothetical protein R3Y43_06080 [Alphaproteobacteria bacterium]
MVSSISSTTSSTIVLEKTIADVNDVDEAFSTARDLGSVRYNHTRVSVLGVLSGSYDSADVFKVNMQSKGNLTLSFMTADSSEESPVDFSKYDAYYEELLKQNDPEGYETYMAEKEDAAKKENLIEYTAPGLSVEVYAIDDYGREVLVADSSAEEGEELRDNFDAMMKGEYYTDSGNYYIKVSRDDTVGETEEISYVMQASMGDNNKYDNVATETLSSDSTNKRETLLSAEMQEYLYGSGSSSASSGAAAAQLLSDAYLNAADRYNNASKWWKS